MTRFAACLLALSAVPAVPAAGQSPAPPAAGTRATLADVAWIAGHWVDDAEGKLSEEVWSAPSGDSMLGMWRYVAGGKLRVQELLNISDHGTGPILRLRHFDPRMTAREEKDAPLALPLVSFGKGEAVFEGPGQPTGRVKLTYRLEAPDVLSVTLDKGAEPQVFRMRRKR
jgi:hypothetical protein